MNQQINLYQPDKPKARESFSARTSVIIIGLCTLVLAVLAYLNHSQVDQQEQRLVDLQAERKVLQQEFDAVREAQLKPHADTALAEKVEQLTAKLASAKQRQEWLSTNQMASISLSKILQQALNAQTQQTRVTSVSLNSDNASVLIEGTTTAPEAISDFLNAVANSPEFIINTDTIELNRQGAMHHFAADLAIQPADHGEIAP